MPRYGKFVIGKVETQSIALFAFETRESAFLAILARMFKPGKRSFLLHPPVIVESMSHMAKLFFGSTFGDLVAPGKLLTLDPVILHLEVLDLGPRSLCPVVFPASKRPVVRMTCNATCLAKIHLLFWGWIQPNHVRTIHGTFLLSTLCAEQRLSALSYEKRKL